jgi:Uma2 family endonuclease
MTSVVHPMTAAEFFAWVHRPENSDRFFELDRGEVVELPRPGKYHGFICANIATILGEFARKRRKGYVCTNNAGVVIERDPDTVRGPDVTFYEDAQTAADMDRQYAARPPLLAVEVLSPDDRINRVIRRITQMLRAGVAVVWLVDPVGRDISVYRPGQDPVLFAEGQELTGDPALPDFRCRVVDFFALPGMQGAP